MAKKRPPHRAVTFRVPQLTYNLLAEVADLQGVDVSAVINRVLADAAPGLRLWVAHQRADQLPDGYQLFLDSLQSFDPTDAAKIRRGLAVAGALLRGQERTPAALEGLDRQLGESLRREQEGGSLGPDALLRWVKIGVALRDGVPAEREGLRRLILGGEGDHGEA